MIDNKPQRRVCKCGCGGHVNPGRSFLMGHSGHKFASGELNPNSSGLSKQHRERISKSHKGKIVSQETRRRMSESKLGNPGYWKGRHHSTETKAKLSELNKGKTPWNKGKTGVYSDETRILISISQMRCRKDGYCDAWSDSDFKDDFTKNYCEDCGRSKRDGWKMNLHHKDFDRRNCHPDNLETLCVRCHMHLHRGIKRRKS